MSSTENYIEKNRDAWNKKTQHHFNSSFYNVKDFLSGKSSLKETELKLLGNISGKSILHLQCHFGQDTLSMARFGANVTGVDLSDEAIKKAEQLATEMNLNARFICCDIFELPNYLSGQFDIVFTSYGTIGWLPDLNKWANIISTFLKPGGEFIFVEFHPVIWMFDDDFKEVAYNYFKDSPIKETESGTYADKSAPITTETISWNHSISEVVTALLDNNLQLLSLNEFDYSNYDCFNQIVEEAPGRYRVRHLGNKIPMMYSIKALKM